MMCCLPRHQNVLHNTCSMGAAERQTHVVFSRLASIPYEPTNSEHELYLEQYWYSSYAAGLPRTIDKDLLVSPTNAVDILDQDGDRPNLTRFLRDHFPWYLEENGPGKKYFKLDIPSNLGSERLCPPYRSPIWRILGFQSDDPRSDFRGGGILSLLLMLSLATKSPELFSAMLQDQTLSPVPYPVSAGLVNIAFMICYALRLQPRAVICSSTTPDKLTHKGLVNAMTFLSNSPSNLEDLFDSCCRCMRILLCLGKKSSYPLQNFQSALATTKDRLITLFEEADTSTIHVEDLWLDLR